MIQRRHRTAPGRAPRQAPAMRAGARRLCSVSRWLVLAMATAAVAVGCTDKPYRERVQQNIELTDQLKKARDRVAELEGQLAAAKAQNQSLMKLGDKRLDLLPQVQRIELSNFTGGYQTQSGARGHNAVKVYLLPRDQDGSVIKTAGTTTVRLYDLSAGEGQTLLGEYTFGPEEMSASWYAGLVMTYHYSFVCPFKRPPTGKEITIRVEFVEYLTGKHFTTTKTVKVDPSAAAAKK